jgi:hypothetical protein
MERLSSPRQSALCPARNLGAFVEEIKSEDGPAFVGYLTVDRVDSADTAMPMQQNKATEELNPPPKRI